jgi:hypothetical protein
MTRAPEAALHRIWETHGIPASHLCTHDGLRVTVLHPGTPNPDSGPDFLQAVIRIGGTTFCGDVEIHTTPAQWHLHRHDTDPRYNRVILHVVGSDPGRTHNARTAAGRTLPLLVLPALPSPLSHLQTDHERIIAQCIARLQRCRDPHRMLTRCGWIRMRRKIRRFAHRLDQLVGEQHGLIAEPGSLYDVLPEECQPPAHHWSRKELLAPDLWDQLLYEGIMEAMGYARNGPAFLLLARTLAIHRLRSAGLHDADTMMGLIFGAAGLLPEEGTFVDAESVTYVRRLRRRWREYALAGRAPRTAGIDWLFFRLRPANFPTARLASMAYLLPVLFDNGGAHSLFHEMIHSCGNDRDRLGRLRQAFVIEPEGHWAHHLHFRDRWKERGVRLGRDRIAVILLNAVLPLGSLYARVSGNERMVRSVRSLVHALPAPHEPHVIREIREKVFGKNGRLGAVEGMGVLEMKQREGSNYVLK